jgi:NAD+ synthase (glutamine-hydrolysing)
MELSICVAQLDFEVGNLSGNAHRIVEAARRAHAAGARLVLTPELALSGSLAQDLLLRSSFMAACDRALAQIAHDTADLPGLTLVVGHPAYRLAALGDTKTTCADLLVNAATVFQEGRVLKTATKRDLSNNRISNERGYFLAGDANDACVFEVAGIKVGLLINQDAWNDSYAQQARASGAQLLAVISAYVFDGTSENECQTRLQDCARNCNLPLVYAHLVGAQDEAVFDGYSFAADHQGSVVARAVGFDEQLLMIQAHAQQGSVLKLKGDTLIEISEPLAQLWSALVVGLRDYVRKNGFSSVILGLSGGMDSALVLALAVDALGPEAVRTVMMPSPYTASISLEDAREMAQRLHVRYDEISILPMVNAFKTSLAPLFEGRPEDLTEENIQARVRGVLLMALSNKFGSLLLATGNKSEFAAGYCTLYGDMCGGYAPIKDVVKTTVFALAHWRNAHDPYKRAVNPIPLRIITRAPSAELRPDQTDQDSLPPYEVLDAIITRYVENDMNAQSIVAEGFNPQDVNKVMHLLKVSEYKRHQSGEGARVTRRAFGKDWRFPITQKFRE